MVLLDLKQGDNVAYRDGVVLANWAKVSIALPRQSSGHPCWTIHVLAALSRNVFALVLDQPRDRFAPDATV